MVVVPLQTAAAAAAAAATAPVPVLAIGNYAQPGDGARYHLREGSWYCSLCSKEATEGHILSWHHVKQMTYIGAKLQPWAVKLVRENWGYEYYPRYEEVGPTQQPRPPPQPQEPLTGDEARDVAQQPPPPPAPLTARDVARDVAQQLAEMRRHFQSQFDERAAEFNELAAKVAILEISCAERERYSLGSQQPGQPTATVGTVADSLLPTGHGAAAGSQQPGQPTATLGTVADSLLPTGHGAAAGSQQPGQPTATDTASDTWPGWGAWSSAGDATWQQAQAGGDGEAAARDVDVGKSAESVERRWW